VNQVWRKPSLLTTLVSKLKKFLIIPFEGKSHVPVLVTRSSIFIRSQSL
jgi:hypothetical protein